MSRCVHNRVAKNYATKVTPKHKKIIAYDSLRYIMILWWLHVWGSCVEKNNIKNNDSWSGKKKQCLKEGKHKMRWRCVDINVNTHNLVVVKKIVYIFLETWAYVRIAWWCWSYSTFQQNFVKTSIQTFSAGEMSPVKNDQNMTASHHILVRISGCNNTPSVFFHWADYFGRGWHMFTRFKWLFYLSFWTFVKLRKTLHLHNCERKQ